MPCNTPPDIVVVYDQFDEYCPPLQGEPCNRDCQNYAVKKELEEALNPKPPP